MKKIGFSLMLCCVLSASLEAQTVSPAASTRTNTAAAAVPATVIARSASSRTWARITSQTNAAGEVSLVTNAAYTELGSGLCYEKGGQWVDAEAAIGLVVDGAAATHTAHKVHFAGNANTAGGAVHLVAPDGKVFDSRVYGLAYWDTASGTSVLLAPLQDSQGTLVGSNRIVYADAFQGLKADLEYLVTKAGLEQNVVLRERPPVPESVAVGLSSATARLEVLTEFFSAPAPAKKRSMVVSGVQEDTMMNFGGMGIAMGKAFLTQGQNGGRALGLGRVSKHWTIIDGRDFLIEEVRYAAISNAVQNLPVQASAAQVGTAVRHLAALQPLLPKEVDSTGAPEAMKLSKSMPGQAGVVLDYIFFDWGDYTTNIVFQSDTTYCIGGDGNGLFLQQGATFEPGTVVKFDASNGSPIQNEGDSHFNFSGSNYRPVVLTSSDDNSVGAPIDGSSGNPSPGYISYLIDDGGGGGATGVAISHVRFSYANTAYEGDNDTSHIFSDCQFVQCGGDAVYVPSDSNLYLENDLFTGCGAVVEGQNLTLDAENITADSISEFAANFNLWWNAGPYGGSIVNSILTACDGSIYDFYQAYTVVADSGAGIYQSVGDGNYYLAPGTYQGAGTPSIDGSLSADLQTKTTCPPTVYANATISGSTNWGIITPRDSCNPGPDLGFHYDPIDYAFGGVTVTNNLTFTPGTVVGWFNGGQGYGIKMGTNTMAGLQGTVTSPVWWVRGNTVQESGGNTAWPGARAVGGLVGQGDTASDSPQANLFFTRCSMLAGGDGGLVNHFADDGGYVTVNAAHSEFYGGMIGGYKLSCCFTNCLMDRMGGGQFGGYTGNAYTITNCTWHGGWLTLAPTNTAIPIVVGDSAFDGTLLSASGYGTNTSYANYNYNAFTSSTNGFPVGGASNVVVTGGFNWQSSWFGNYYLPSGSPLCLRGDVTADKVGLYHFTTQLSEVPEGTNRVSIGYHYVATDDNGNPLDSNADGIPDYLQDANGNGLVDQGDLGSWLPVVTDTHGWIGLSVFTPLQ